MTPNLIDQYLPRVRTYLSTRRWDEIPEMANRSYSVTPLAAGEYNLNYLLESTENKLVLRVNISSQIDREDQIVYEYNSLKLLQNSGVTPIPYFVDDSRRFLDRGVLLMEYLDGGPLDYHRDLVAAAETFSRIHQIKVDESRNHLIVEQQPLTLIYDECAGLLDTYLHSPLTDGGIRDFLVELLHWAAAEKAKEQYYIDDPWLCIVNSEVNSGNFIVNKERGSIHLIDWEMARWGDPSTDLCHFCSPLTTLWKSDYRMSEKDQAAFLGEYKRRIGCAHLRNTLDDRCHLKLPFVMLRGISWSAMAWVAYRTDYQGIRNEDTFQKINRYMNLEFIRSLFLPFMQT